MHAGETETMLRIGILARDDIGAEVVPQAVKVMKAAALKTGLDIEWHELPLGQGENRRNGRCDRRRHPHCLS
jgi:isocitrate/isopropylmalate dehydrogenase